MTKSARAIVERLRHHAFIAEAVIGDSGEVERLEPKDSMLEAATVITELEAERDRIERNRDMWKGQCERQAAQLTLLRTLPLQDSDGEPQ